MSNEPGSSYRGGSLDSAGGVDAPGAVKKAAKSPQPVQPAPDSGTAPAAPSSEAAKLVVTAGVKAEIDLYLKGLTSENWALAISRDGTRTAKFRCGQIPAAGCGASHGMGASQQEKANENAIKRCGGPTACSLLYEGAVKKASVEIVVQ